LQSLSPQVPVEQRLQEGAAQRMQVLLVE